MKSESANLCPACQSQTPAGARFCPACGGNLGTIAEADRRIITVMFADLTGFTGLTEQLDAEEVHNLIARWLDPLCGCVTRWGGFVDKFIGDCVMALFGAPVAYENEEERAVRAALDMQAAIEAEPSVSLATGDGASYHPQLRIGINTGPVVTGMFGGGGAVNYTVIGDVVNVASRLQNLCEPGSILVGEATYRRTHHVFDYGDALTLQVRGREEPVIARPVVGQRTVRGKIRGPADRQTPHIGRTKELDRLREGWRQAERGHAQVELLLGESGIGKSRLVAELAIAESISDDHMARGRSYPYAASTPWEPVIELIRDLHGVAAGTPVAEMVRSVARNAARSWLDEEVSALTAALGGPAADDDTWRALAPDERRDWMQQAVTRAIEEAPRSPCLLVLEDLHWADRTTLDFFTAMVKRPVRGAFQIVLVSRPPLPDELPLIRLIERFPDPIRLHPLSYEESRTVVQSMLGLHAIPGDLLATILERAGGVPLFLEEMVKAVIEGGAHEGDREFKVPDSIDSLLTTRIDRLDPAAKRVLQYAAIVGRRFWSGVLSDAMANQPVDSELAELQAGNLVRARPESVVAGEREFAFEHLMLQEVAYDGLLRGLRSAMHGTVAAWLQERLAGRSAEFDEFVAWHYERSNEPERAVPFLERAVNDAWNRGALLDVESLLDRALAAATDVSVRARLLLRLDDVATATGNDARRLQAIDELESLAQSGEDPALCATAAYRRARRLLDIGELARAREVGANALEPFRRIGDGSSEADVLTLLGQVAHLQGAYDNALTQYRAALPLERDAGDRFGEAEILRRLGQAEADFGHFTQALEYFDQALEIYVEINHRPLQAVTHASKATTYCWLGLIRKANGEARRAEDLAVVCGSRSAQADASLSRAIAQGAAGRVEEAKKNLEGVIAVASELRRTTLEARAWLALGNLESEASAVEAVEKAREAAARSGLVHVEVFALTRLAELALARKDLRSADRDSARAVELLEDRGDIQGPDEVIYYVRSKVLTALKRKEEARSAMQRAREIVQETASWIDDPAMRREFLESVHPNPLIMAAGPFAKDAS